ncbi:uncharacterized protein LOC141686126 [Apium graveolens]|uniref:uncharacterized protein LOC141686126 n=1 Tax=Apium graveolens TaxID=4045 RepID=UPI003D7BB9DB
MAWGRMCEAKESGGLGYKDLQQYNLAVLAKQGWRLVNGENILYLPIAVDLRIKHVNMETVCSWCHNYKENDIHVMFDCVFARAVWEAVGLTDLVQVAPDENVFDVFLRICTQCTRSQEESTRRTGQSVGSRVWKKPIMGWVKINTDATVIPGTHQIGTGAVIRDEDGHFLHARCMDISGEWSVKEAEARSLRDAGCWKVAMRFRKCIFELDSKIVVDACNGGSGRSNFYSFIGECVEDFKHLDEVRVQFTYKSANIVAHTLARASISMSGFHEWQGNAPEFISDVERGGASPNKERSSFSRHGHAVEKAHMIKKDTLDARGKASGGNP